MTSNQRSIPRVAILGAGMIAHRHVDRWKQAGAEVVAVADIDKEVLQAFTEGFSGSYFGTKGAIVGHTLNGEPFDYPGRELAQQAPRGKGDQWLLPHVVGPHRDIEEQHVFEAIMQLVDWIREDKPSIVTAEHARHVIEIIAAAYRAAATGQTQELTTAFSHQPRLMADG